MATGLARIAVGALWAVTACASRTVPDPRAAAEQYRTAAESGDADALYALLASTERAQHAVEQVRQLARRDRAELQQRARALGAPGTRVEGLARLRFDDGEEVALALRDGHFRIESAGTLPAGAHTPEQALDQLRRVLARRSYPALLGLLTPSTRAAVEHDLRSLVSALERPDTISVRVTGDLATAIVSSGHRVRLRQEDGLWRVEDFD